MENNRRLIRLNVGDFLEIRPLDEVGKIFRGQSNDLTLMGICFLSENQWQKGQVLFIDYFIPDELDSVKLKMVVIWSEYIDAKNGHFCGGEIIDIDEAKQEKFANYYFKKLKDKFF